MNRKQMRDLLRKRIHEKDGTESQWTDAELNTLLDLAVQDVQKTFLRTSADSFAVVYVAGRVAAKTRTPLPGGFIHELMVQVKAATGDEYEIANKNSNLNMTSQAPLAGEKPEYVILGEWLKIVPAPAADVTDGIRFTFVKNVNMDADTVVPPVRLIWHEDIVTRAKQKAYGETEERSAVADIAWREHKEDVPTTHRETHGGAGTVDVEGINKDY